MYFYFKSIRVIILTSELVAMDTIRNKTSIKVTLKEHTYLKTKVRRGTPRKMQNPAAENRIFCRGKSWARDLSLQGTSTSTSTSTCNYLSSTTQVPTVAKAHYS